MQPYWKLGRKTRRSPEIDGEGKSDGEDEDEGDLDQLLHFSSKSFLVDLQRLQMPATSPAGRKLRAFHAEMAALKNMHAPELKELLESLTDETHKNVTLSTIALAKQLEDCYNEEPMSGWDGKTIEFTFKAIRCLPAKIKREWKATRPASDDDSSDEDDEELPSATAKRAAKATAKQSRPFGWGARL